MANDNLEQTVMSILVKAYQLGREFERQHRKQSTVRSYDQLCENVAERTEELHTRVMALFAEQTPADIPQCPPSERRTDNSVPVLVPAG